MTTTSAGARRLGADARREQILQCAVRLFGERPYSAVSTAELAESAGVTRGLLHHYFGTKRGLYVEVVRKMLTAQTPKGPGALAGTRRERVEACVDYFLNAVGANAKTWARVAGAEGVGDDPEIEQILAEADDHAARLVLAAVAPHCGNRARERAAIRSWGAMVKAAVREWVNDNLTRDEVRLLLVESLLALVEQVLPTLNPKAAQR